MNMQSWLRLLASAVIAFCSYAAWAYYANSLVTTNTTALLKAAIVQGTYSAAVTLAFTFLLEVFYTRFKSKTCCLAFIVPRLNQDSPDQPCKTKRTFDASLRLSKQTCSGRCLPGVLISPLPALLIQSVLVIAINIIFATPNLWLTVAPSILFSGIYGYAYSIGLHRKSQHYHSK